MTGRRKRPSFSFGERVVFVHWNALLGRYWYYIGWLESIDDVGCVTMFTLKRAYEQFVTTEHDQVYQYKTE